MDRLNDHELISWQHKTIPKMKIVDLPMNSYKMHSMWFEDHRFERALVFEKPFRLQFGEEIQLYHENQIFLGWRKKWKEIED